MAHSASGTVSHKHLSKAAGKSKRNSPLMPLKKNSLQSKYVVFLSLCKLSAPWEMECWVVAVRGEGEGLGAGWGAAA